MKLTMTDARALLCAPGTHASSSHTFRGATPFGTGVEGTSVSRVRAANVVVPKLATDKTIDKTIDPAMGSVARGRPL